MSLVLSKTFTWWDPVQVSPALWLDAADSTTVTADGSNLVSQINDKSGNGRNFTASTTARPTYTSSGQNGRNVLTFNGTSNYLSRTNYVYGTTHSLFLVFKYTRASSITSAAPGQGVLGTPTDGAGNVYIGGFAGAIANERLGYYAGGTGGFFINDADIDATSPLLLSFSVNSGQAGAVRRLNGASNFVQTFGTGVPSAIQQIGASNSAEFMQGLFCELIITTAFLSAANIEKTEGYLAHKWGLTANLPADHPYKTSKPAP